MHSPCEQTHTHNINTHKAKEKHTMFHRQRMRGTMVKSIREEINSRMSAASTNVNGPSTNRSNSPTWHY
jgi:hypothetical protein